MAKKSREGEGNKSRDANNPGEVPIFALNPDGSLKWANRSFFEIFSLKQEEQAQINVQSLVSPRSSERAQAFFSKPEEEERALIYFLKNGRKELPLELRKQTLYYPNGEKEVIFITGEGGAERSKRVREAYLRIVTQALTGRSLQGFFRTLHAVLNDLVPARNFYVAFFDQERDRIAFPYYVDDFKKSKRGSRKKAKGLTEWVLNSRKPLLLETKNDFLKMVERGEVEVLGTPPESWMGVPLMVKGKAYGVLAVQSYEKEVALNEEHLELLFLVSQTLSALILRLRFEESEKELKQSLALLFESCPDPIYVKDLKGRYQMVNQAFMNALNLPESEILGKTASDLFDPNFAERIISTDRELIKSDGPMRLEESLTWGGKTRVYDTIKTPMRNGRGKPIGILGISREITERKLLEESLENARMDLLYSISHELKSPLTFLFSAFEVLQNSSPEEIPRVFSRWSTPMERNLKRLKRLVDNLVDTLRIREAKYPLSLSPSDLPTIVKECWEDLESYAQTLNVRASFEIGDVPVLSLDREAISRVVSNLLSNALKYSRHSSRIFIRLFQSGKEVIFQVQDEGIGIPPEEMDSIFEPFFRTRESSKRALPGTGLGLYVSRKIVEAHEGTLSLQSEVGKGTTVTVKLPLRASGEEFFPGPNSG